MTTKVEPADGSQGQVTSPDGALMAAAEQAATQGRTGVTVWLTGLPSAGKTTLARNAADGLTQAGRDVQVLDGDELREYLSLGLGFGRADRDTNVMRIGFVARLLAMHGVTVLAPVIAPYRETRAQVRELHTEAGVPFIEVFVDAPVEVCAERDVKGLYAQQRAGALSHLTGVDDPYEPPLDPSLHLRTATNDLAQCSRELVAHVLSVPS